MAIVDVKIGTRTYSLACEEGQENNLLETAGLIDEKYETLARQLRTGNEPLLLLLTALTIQDEFNEYKEANPKELTEAGKKSEHEMAELLNTVSGYIERVTTKIEKS